MNMTSTTTLVLIALLSQAFAICPDGQFTSSTGVCTPCPPGTVSRFPRSAEDGADDRCEGCPPGTFQPYHGVVGAALCRACLPGMFSTVENATSCDPCPAGTDSNWGYTRCLHCPAGRFLSVVTKGCDDCRINGYTVRKNSRYCFRCGFGMKARGVPPVSPKGEGPDEWCEPCISGDSCNFYCRSSYKAAGTAECIRCPMGTILDTTDGSSVEDCKPCPKGSIQYGGQKTCQQCPRFLFGTHGTGGSLCLSSNGDMCPSDMFRNKNGDCTRCLPGYFQSFSDGECKLCPERSYSRGGVAKNCRRCGGNTVDDPTRRECFCPAGSFRVSDSRCKKCPRGMHSASVGNRCFECFHGMFAKKRGALRCTPCPYGYISSDGLGSRSCKKCPMGMTTDIVSDSEGSFHTSCVSETTGCYPGGLRRNTTYISCRENPCDRNSTTEDAEQSCIPCRFNGFLRPNGPGCDICPPGEISQGGLVTKCEKCPPGQTGIVRYDSNGGKVFCACQEGRGIKAGICQKCEPGFFSGKEDSVCMPCKGGTFSKRAGVTTCKSCRLDTFSTGGAVECEDCPSGTVGNKRRRANACVPVSS